MRICAALDIPFHFLDAEDAYKTEIADYMIAEYKSGRTPNPDVLCNRIIKFGVMWEYAKSHGADFIATGHYAQNNAETLVKGNDSAKDQSYFLWMIEKTLLPHILFPIGHLQKSEVRRIAEKANLFTATKKDSQGICFLGDVDMQEFLSHYIEEKEGSVINEEGVIVGKHKGAVFYTLGERHGFTITETTSERAPYYVIAKDIEKNILVVAHSPLQSTQPNEQQMLTLRNVNWFSRTDPSKQYTAQIRYHGSLIKAHIQDEKTVDLSYNGVIALGQSLVLYDGEMLVGGGIIDCVQ